MILTKENLTQWKQELSEQMLKQYELPEFADTMDDEWWLNSYLGQDTQVAIDDEVENWEGE